MYCLLFVLCGCGCVCLCLCACLPVSRGVVGWHQVEVRRQREVMEAKFHDQRLRQQEAVDTAVAAALNKERDLALEARKTMVEQYEEQLSVCGVPLCVANRRRAVSSHWCATQKMRERLAGEMDAEHRRIGESHRVQARRHAEEVTTRACVCIDQRWWLCVCHQPHADFAAGSGTSLGRSTCGGRAKAAEPRT